MHRSRSNEQYTVSKFEILEDLSFFLRLKYSEFPIDFLQSSRSHKYLHHDFFPNFFKTSKCYFQIFQKNELHLSTLT
jgi:hypothetical protein